MATVQLLHTVHERVISSTEITPEMQLISLDTIGMTGQEITDAWDAYKAKTAPRVATEIEVSGITPYGNFWWVWYALNKIRIEEETRNGVKVRVITITDP